MERTSRNKSAETSRWLPERPGRARRETPAQRGAERGSERGAHLPAGVRIAQLLAPHVFPPRTEILIYTYIHIFFIPPPGFSSRTFPPPWDTRKLLLRSPFPPAPPLLVVLCLFCFCSAIFFCCCCWKTRLRFASRASPERPGAAPAARAAPPRLTACQPGGAARLGVARLGSARLGRSPPIMQSYKYDKAIPPESKNGGSPALNNNPAKSSSKKALLICLDFLCLVMGEQPRELRGAPRPFPPLLSPPTSPQPPPQPPGLLLWESLAEGGRAELGRAPAVPLPKQKRSGARSGAAGRGERGAGQRRRHRPGRGARPAGVTMEVGAGANGAAVGQPAPRAKWWAQHPSHLDLLFNLFIFCFSHPATA